MDVCVCNRKDNTNFILWGDERFPSSPALKSYQGKQSLNSALSVCCSFFWSIFLIQFMILLKSTRNPWVPSPGKEPEGSHQLPPTCGFLVLLPVARYVATVTSYPDIFFTLERFKQVPSYCPSLPVLSPDRMSICVCFSEIFTLFSESQILRKVSVRIRKPGKEVL